MKSISAFEIIKVGIGPSSSHTMGPWKAAEMFLNLLQSKAQLAQVRQLKVHLYGSLALTGIGHGTDVAVLLGLSGEDYTRIDTDTIPTRIDLIKHKKELVLNGKYPLPFSYEEDIVFSGHEFLPFHANGMRFEVFLANGEGFSKEYYSVGGGFVATEEESILNKDSIATPYPCHQAADIASNCQQLNLSVSELVWLNEQAWRPKQDTKALALHIWQEIKSCIYRGIRKTGQLPGGLGVKRRAAEINKKLLKGQSHSKVEEWIKLIKETEKSFTNINKWVSCFALAVNEENASFGRVVTAPTNGASGVLPAVLMYAHCFENFTEERIIEFLLVAGEIGTIFKKNATISAAMGGCQAEIGVSSAMAAAGLTEGLGGSPDQVLMAAEIAMEHHLGLTCDPIAGLVQIPCIERNTMGSIKAITAAHIALESDPSAAKVSLDGVIKSMWETAKDMHHKYKETSEGGLAVNVPVNLPEC